jgi:hypothetical protein
MSRGRQKRFDPLERATPYCVVLLHGLLRLQLIG